MFICKFISHRYRQDIAKMWRGKSRTVDQEHFKEAPNREGGSQVTEQKMKFSIKDFFSKCD